MEQESPTALSAFEPHPPVMPGDGRQPEPAAPIPPFAGGNPSPVERARLPLELTEARLGVASSLFAALSSKHLETAQHSLRVALNCSSWAFALELSDAKREQIEVAALFHDIGKIGVPDNILLKAAPLTPDEEELMSRHRFSGVDILKACCPSEEVLDIMRHCSAWYDGTRYHRGAKGREIPLGARMLAIIDAFDSMSSHQSYRQAMSREQAIGELFRCAGQQFDPDLVKNFSSLFSLEHFIGHVAQRWLTNVAPETRNSLWGLGQRELPSGKLLPEMLFYEKLLDNMQDAVIFVDRAMQILMWNRGAERISGRSGAAMRQRVWNSHSIGIRDPKGRAVTEADCPVVYALQTASQSFRRLLIRGPSNEYLAVDVHAVPVMGSDGVTYGAAVLLHDASPQASLEQRCQSLHEKATKDPLTQVANRAEFDRTLKVFVGAHQQRKMPCSLIITDIDRFKSINDRYGHQAGDDALKNFAQVLKSCCRPGDLVARYGGEEFVILCANCNNATAAERADHIRRAISEIPQSSLEGKSITASFGVTEVQSGDSPDSMLGRADRALLEAKERGRNRVVQLGTGIRTEEAAPKRRFWFWKQSPPELLVQQWLVTSVPLNVSVEKIRGFVADHQATIVSIEGHALTLTMDGHASIAGNAFQERSLPLLIELRLAEERAADDHATKHGPTLRTKVHVAIRPRRDRDRRRADMAERARLVIASLKAYLMATEDCATVAADGQPPAANFSTAH